MLFSQRLSSYGKINLRIKIQTVTCECDTKEVCMFQLNSFYFFISKTE